MSSGREISDDLVGLGVQPGMTLLVHASLRSLGPVEGGPPTVVASLRHALGTTGTLVVPTGTPDNSDTSRVHLKAVEGMDAQERARYCELMPGFDPRTTPSTGMGAIAETVRTSPGAFRSIHPQTSFAALGASADVITSGHAETCHLGENSPLRRLYDRDAQVLLLGVGYDSCSAFHLAEYRYLSPPRTRLYRCVVMRAGVRHWWEYRDVDLDDRDFGEIGRALDATGVALHGRVAAAMCTLVSLRGAVDFAVNWMQEYRHHRT